MGRCQYIYIRGQRRGMRCGDETVDDEMFCRMCKKLNSAKKQAENPVELIRTEGSSQLERNPIPLDALVFEFSEPEEQGVFDSFKDELGIIVEKKISSTGTPFERVFIPSKKVAAVVSNLMIGRGPKYPYSEPRKGINRIAFAIHEKILLRSWEFGPGEKGASLVWMDCDLYIPLILSMNLAGVPAERANIRDAVPSSYVQDFEKGTKSDSMIFRLELQTGERMLLIGVVKELQNVSIIPEMTDAIIQILRRIAQCSI